MKSLEIMYAIKQRLNQYRHYNHVAVVFLNDGGRKTRGYLTEAQVRALQVEAAARFKFGGQKMFDEFVSSFIIYDGPTVKGHKPMTLRTDGFFKEEFTGGFFSANSNLAFELF